MDSPFGPLSTAFAVIVPASLAITFVLWKRFTGRVTGVALAWLYVALSVVLGILLCSWNLITLGASSLPDSLLVLAIAPAILFLPMVFAAGAWWVRRRAYERSGSIGSGWAAVALYALASIGIWLAVRGLGRRLEVGTDTGWLVSLSTVVGQSSYLLLFIAALTFGIAVISGLVSTVRRRLRQG